MADKTTSQENLSGAVADADYVRGVKGGLNVRVTFSLIKTWIQSWIVASLVAVGAVRPKLTANQNFYVDFALGLDTNTGLVGFPKKTINAMIDVASGYDCGIYDVTINVADNANNTGVFLKAMLGSGAFVIKGNSVTPANCTIAGGATHAIFGGATYTAWTIDGFTLTSAAGNGVFFTGICSAFLTNIEFGAVASSHITVSNGSRVGVFGSTGYIVKGGAVNHINISDASFSCSFQTITTNGGPAIGTWLRMVGGFVTLNTNVYAGAGPAVGCQKYLISLNGVGNSGVVLPGSVAGAVATGGQYV